MKPVQQNENKVIVVILDRTSPNQKPPLNPAIFKTIRLIMITLISWLNPEAAIAIFLIKLLFILLEWRNQNNRS
ncbi:MAG: hypothetical protein AAFQ80_02425 [Cyanobacteria bacterium J06621_8]